MRGQVTEVLKVYGMQERQLVIPVYQRNYDWGLKQCQQLLEDLVNVIQQGRPKHFFGAVVGQPEGSWRWVVIDGQQRLTTVSLLMLALADLLDEGTLESRDPGLAHRIRTSFLLLNEQQDTPRFKLKPVKHDADAYALLFRSDSDHIDTSSVTANYRFFKDQIPRLPIDGDDLWAAVERLEVMHLDLEQHDDAQRIFESLNSTGLALSEADKVRNLVLMGLDVHEQERVYTDYWNRIEVNVGYDTGAFLRWYLVTRTSRIPRQDQVYESFKKYITETGLRGAELLDGVRKYSTYYRQIRTATTGSSKIDLRLRRLNLLKTDVVLPLLMPLFESRETGEITDLDLAECIRTVESYIFRRYIAEVPTNALNKVFATVYRDVKRIRPENRSFAEVLGYSLRKRSGSGAFPDDAEFISSLEVKNLYNFKGERRKYLFECLENLDSNDTRDIANGIEDGSLTIEHVMPQTLTQAWHDELGDEAQRIHEQWLNRLGNLTVTGYNSSYSNSSYSTKRTMKHGFMESPFRLNLQMRSAEHWGEDQLAARTRRLCADALTYWIYPESDFEPARPQLPTEALGTDTNFTGRAAVSFTWNEHHATVANWRDLTARVFTILLVEHRDEFLQWARTSDWFRVGAAYDPDENGVYRLDDSIGWNASSSTWTKVSLMRRVFSHLELDPEELIITLRSDETAERGQETAETAEGENFPYLEIVKFLPRLVELEGMATDDPLVQETVEEFMQSFHPFRDEQPLKTLGTSVRKFCADPERRAAATAEETIALISSKVDETEHVDPDALAEAAVGGTLSLWVGRLRETSPST